MAHFLLMLFFSLTDHGFPIEAACLNVSHHHAEIKNSKRRNQRLKGMN